MEDKILFTIGVPCYNSQDYMRKCIDSLLTGGEDVEIIIVNDGSTDHTGTIADQYAAEHPSIVRVIHQENGGYGSAVNVCIQNAKGQYFKMVDSDDWLDTSAFIKVLETLKKLRSAGSTVDMMICNYVYDKTGAKHKRVMRYRDALPKQKILNWSDVSRLNRTQYIPMHSIIYRTGLLRECGLELPRHTFYVDNLYVFIPMQHAKSLYYLDVDLYHYLTGREGQSVQENIMIGRIDQQLMVNRLLVDHAASAYTLNKRQESYLFSYLGIITLISSILLIRAGAPEHIAKKKQLWNYIQSQDRVLYRKLRRSLFGILAHTPKHIAVLLYKLASSYFGFN